MRRVRHQRRKRRPVAPSRGRSGGKSLRLLRHFQSAARRDANDVIMQLRYEEDFLEAAVLLCVSGRRSDIAPLQVARFHREREKLYAIPDPDERNAGFFRLHLDWFQEWGLEKLLTSVLSEFP